MSLALHGLIPRDQATDLAALKVAADTILSTAPLPPRAVVDIDVATLPGVTLANSFAVVLHSEPAIGSSPAVTRVLAEHSTGAPLRLDLLPNQFSVR